MKTSKINAEHWLSFDTQPKDKRKIEILWSDNSTTVFKYNHEHWLTYKEKAKLTPLKWRYAPTSNEQKLWEKQKVLMAMNKEYTIKVVNGNYELISDLFWHKTFKKGDYTMDELKFIKKVRHYVVKNEIYLKPIFIDNQVFVDDVHYVKVARVPIGKTYSNVCEVDIDQAYWETAYQLGIINSAIYTEGSKGNISKKARLTALGSLAKKKYHYKFVGDKVVDTIIEKEPLLENLWFTVCKRVSDVMHKVIFELGSDFIFYWVDGIYFKNTPENVQKAMKVFIDNGYNSKFKRINQIHFHQRGFTVNDYGDIKREFSYPQYNKQGKKINHAESFKLTKLANKVLHTGLDMVDQIKAEMKEYEANEKSKNKKGNGKK